MHIEQSELSNATQATQIEECKSNNAKWAQHGANSDAAWTACFAAEEVADDRVRDGATADGTAEDVGISDGFAVGKADGTIDIDGTTGDGYKKHIHMQKRM